MALIPTDYLSGSDGTGDASLMHVASNRTIGSTVLVPDTIVGVPQNFIATTGTVDATGFIDPATARTFYGHINGSNLEIDAFAAGNVDAGNTIGQVIVIKPTTEFANKVKDALTDLRSNWKSFTPLALVYVSASSFKITGVNMTTAIVPGMSVRVTNSTVKDFTVLTSTFAAGDTTVTVIGPTMLAAGAMTALYTSSAFGGKTIGLAVKTSRPTTGATAAASISLSSTVTIPEGGRYVEISVSAVDMGANGAPDNVYIGLWDGVVGVGTQVAYQAYTTSVANSVAPVNVKYVAMIAAGTIKTYNVSLHQSGAATAFIDNDIQLHIKTV